MRWALREGMLLNILTAIFLILLDN